MKIPPVFVAGAFLLHHICTGHGAVLSSSPNIAFDFREETSGCLDFSFSGNWTDQQGLYLFTDNWSLDLSWSDPYAQFGRNWVDYVCRWDSGITADQRFAFDAPDTTGIGPGKTGASITEIRPIRDQQFTFEIWSLHSSDDGQTISGNFRVALQNSVPEPAAWPALGLAGLFGAFHFIARRRRAHRARALV